MATYTKLRDGSWGVKVRGKATVGQTVTVTKRDGQKKTETITQVLWTGDGVSLCAISAARETGHGRPTQATRRAANKAPLASGRCIAQRMREPNPAASEKLLGGTKGAYELGATKRYPKIPGGGGPGGIYWTIILVGQHRISQAEDDTREGEMYYEAIIRPATDDEARPVAERIAAADAAAEKTKAAMVILTTGESLGRGKPAGDCHVLGEKPGGSPLIACDYVAEIGGVCYHVRPVYDDSPVYTRLAADRAAIDAALIDAGWAK